MIYLLDMIFVLKGNNLYDCGTEIIQCPTYQFIHRQHCSSILTSGPKPKSVAVGDGASPKNRSIFTLLAIVAGQLNGATFTCWGNFSSWVMQGCSLTVLCSCVYFCVLLVKLTFLRWCCWASRSWFWRFVCKTFVAVVEMAFFQCLDHRSWLVIRADFNIDR